MVGTLFVVVLHLICSEIFKLFSDWKISSSSEVLTCCSASMPWAARFFFKFGVYLTQHRHCDAWMRFNLLKSTATHDESISKLLEDIWLLRYTRMMIIRLLMYKMMIDAHVLTYSIWPLKSTQRHDVIVIYERLLLNQHALFEIHNYKWCFILEIMWSCEFPLNKLAPDCLITVCPYV